MKGAVYEVAYEELATVDRLRKAAEKLLAVYGDDVTFRYGTDWRTGRQDPRQGSFWELRLSGLFVQRQRGEERSYLFGFDNFLRLGPVRVEAWEDSHVKVRGRSIAVVEQAEKCVAHTLSLAQGLA